MKKKIVLLALLTGMFSLFGCGNTENEFTVGTCYFVYDNSVHQDATLASAMNPSAPGIFCIVTKSMRNGANYFDFTSSAGQTSSKIFNALDERRTLALGYNGSIIVGFGALSQPAVFYAFDRECPNCFDPNAIPIKSRPLSLTTTGLATCGVCHRNYDLNNNGFISSGDDGKRLTRYRAATTGPFGILSVN